MSFEVHDDLFREVLPFHPHRLISLIADAVIGYERQQSLGYYPALEYLFAEGAVARQSIDVFETICRFVAQAATDTIMHKLKAAFSQVRIISLHHTAYNIPAVRPTAQDAHTALVRHYQPSRLQMNLELSQIHKRPVADGYESFVRYLLHRWLRESFADIELAVIGVYLK